ncbi:uncharacterized protein LOC131687631 [Topomyia yanbarensis]|uniref:uncharacterized protein LOC131687631 n=1 Tax=Topomyia yanbarensis TaxID=2498891 RepID=UPI00273A9CC4|nr:uncharacterized protein LOC131687631 [Topomyia yanbarensis]
MKPSQLLNEMSRVAGNSLGETVLLDLWATRLPPHAQAAVIASKGDAAERTTIADAIVDSMGLRNINAVVSKMQQGMTSRLAPEKPAQCSIESLQPEIAQLSSKLEKVLSSRSSGSSRGRSRSRLHNDGKTKFVHRDKKPVHELCWYHRVFGNEARRCRKPCSFSQSAGSTNNQ